MYNDNPVPQAVVERKLEEFSFSNSYVFVKTYLLHIRAIISELLLHSPEGNTRRNAQDIYPWCEFAIY